MYSTSSNPVIEIPLSKMKLFWLLAGSLLFVAAGLFFIAKPYEFTGDGRRPTWEIILIGYLSIAFFGACAVLALNKLFDKKVGLTIDKNGITDNSGGASVGFVPWSDVTGLRVEALRRQKFIVITVSNPQEYINRQNNFLKRNIVSANYKFYGSPVNISSNGLKCNFDELYELISSHRDNYRNGAAVEQQF